MFRSISSDFSLSLRKLWNGLDWLLFGDCKGFASDLPLECIRDGLRSRSVAESGGISFVGKSVVDSRLIEIISFSMGSGEARFFLSWYSPPWVWILRPEFDF
mmetsp:Transcript_23041/g.35632  ORF Transcript_23041/g.35632 Transcript_23041/m.35632 type:complete len:102 (+) Transcript_23041:1677-1982(+)